ncbi:MULTISPECIES: GNAT family N-acetyltransferase [Peribacillus]|uniref:GNAT family N-acetyltransferase n=1 Tax=Peribacillus TaxID=2675229 RepID=UPI0019115BB6|nr:MULTISPECIES: GNAT family protein [unclassified Peribacillus]MBK5445138.1 GNAT family N-acetyltransferase [Peribacillus sp. TH24]MBK5460142.1 GNAT family N-acetyltransferase [Peribacillus sp. TH27]MBK5481957.1 GNAT family N-acetyltransferase [Peribacillus sp. TH16]MBK5498331.1 GNAT family N-acetyltransferase [Peribacillus sp. TH14]WMX56552.1 GNAT family protein [Peribacillus sp. R9-11]
MFPILETERLILREITKEDAEGIFACFSNENVTRYYGQETLESIEEAEKFVDFFSNNYNEKRGIRWGIEKKETKGIIGTIGFNAWLPKHKRAEIGYEIHPEQWGKGYASEAVSRVLTYGFDVMNLTRIGAVVFLNNEASNKLLTNIGFQKEGVLKKYMYQNGIAHDTYVYSLLKNNK